MGKNNRPPLTRGKLRFIQDDTNGICYAHLKTKELFEIKDFEFLNTRAKSFSRKVNVFVVSQDKNLMMGDYLLHNDKLCKVTNKIDDFRVRVVKIRNIRVKSDQWVWDIVSGNYILAHYARYIKEHDGYTSAINTIRMPNGEYTLTKTAKLSTDEKESYILYYHAAEKVYASTDISIGTRRIKERQLKHIIQTNGRLRDVKFSVVPDGYIKLKSQKEPKK